MLVLGGCVQPSMAPSINAAAARVLDRIGISLIDAPAAGCCGAVTYHLNYQDDSLAYVRRNIDAWWPHVEAGAEAIVITASGCGTMVKDYGHLLRHDKDYAAKAERISAMTRDVSEIVVAERGAIASRVKAQLPAAKIAFHSPCSLQHGQKIVGAVEGVLRDAGFTLTPVPDGHSCCGSAGTYSLLKPELSKRLLHARVRALRSGHPAEIATANIGCLAHIGSGTDLPVRHWIEMLEERLA
jgi:glycolate oxidase iron-sulfur subunit